MGLNSTRYEMFLIQPIKKQNLLFRATLSLAYKTTSNLSLALLFTKVNVTVATGTVPEPQIFLCQQTTREMSLKRARGYEEEEEGVGKQAKMERKRQARKQHLLDIPTACLSLILSFLSITENITVLRKVCRAFNTLAHLPSSWPPSLNVQQFVDSIYQGWRWPFVDLLERLPKGYQPTSAIFPGQYGQITETYLNVSGERLRSLSMYQFSGPRSTEKEFVQFLSSIRDLKVLHVSELPYYMDLFGFLASPECQWELEILDVHNAFYGQIAPVPLEPDVVKAFCQAPALRSLSELDMWYTAIQPEAVSHLANHLKQLQVLKLHFPTCPRNLFSTLFKGLSQLRKCDFTFFEDDSPRKDAVEQSLLEVDPADMPLLSHMDLHLMGVTGVSWRSIAKLCSGPSMEEIDIIDTTHCVIKIEQDEKKEQERLARDAALVKQCRSTVRQICAGGYLGAFARGLITVLTKLGSSVTTLSLKADIGYNEELFVSLAQFWKELRTLWLFSDVQDRDLAQLSTLPHLRHCTFGSEEGDFQPSLTVGCFPILKSFPALQYAEVPVEHLEQTPEYEEWAAYAKEHQIQFYVAR